MFANAIAKNIASAVRAVNVTSHEIVICLMALASVGRKDQAQNQRFGNLLIWKFKGEEAVRNSGVPYTIVRPGGLTGEPGGEKAMLFLQGDDRRGKIPRADLARVLVAALSLAEARGKTFELFGGEGPPSIDLQIQLAAMEED